MPTRSRTGTHTPLDASAHLAVLAGALWLGATVDVADAGGPVGAVHGPDVIIETVPGGWRVTAPDGSIINYTSFNIDFGEMVEFVQGASDARVLNRINGGAPTIIQGQLFADGIVYWVNPAGVFFGPTAVVDASRIYAAAGDISDSNFQNGVDLFTGIGGDTFNFGSISADQIHMLGRHVSNQGTLESGGGVITMVSGNSIMLQQFGDRVSVRVDGKTLTDRNSPYAGFFLADIGAQPAVSNSGTITNHGGTVTLAAGDLFFDLLGVRNTGTIEAEGGRIEMLAATGAVLNDGVLDASSTAGPGGTVLMQAPSVVHRGDILVDAPGGDGVARLEGYHHTLLGPGSTVSATGGSGTGDGGTIVIDAVTGLVVIDSDALLNATRGSGGGNDGSITIEGGSVVVNGTILLGPAGMASNGTLRIGSTGFLGSPMDMYVRDGGGDDAFFAPWFDLLTLAGDGNAYINTASLNGVSGDISLAAFRDIFVENDLTVMGGNDLTLQALTGLIHLEGTLAGFNDLTATAASDILIDDPLHLTGNADLTAALIRLRGDEIVTGGTQVYNGNVRIGSHMVFDGPQITFNGTVNSAWAQACSTCPSVGFKRNVTVFGDVVFNGAVGDEFALRNLEVHGGTTMKGGLVRTLDDQLYDGDVWLGSDTITESMDDGDITFAGAIDGARSLDIVTGGATQILGTVGGHTPLDRLRTDADGTTHLGANVHANRVILRDQVVLEDDVRVRGDSTVRFGDTVDGAYALKARSNGSVAFGGDVGGSVALTRFTTDVRSADGNGVILPGLVHATGDIDLNPNGHEGATVATLVGLDDVMLVSDSGSVNMGQGEKLSVLGDLDIQARRARLGDVNTLGDLRVDASRIEILARPAGFVRGTDGALTNDLGVDMVAGGRLRFSTAPALVGDGNVFFAAHDPDPMLDADRTDTIAGVSRSDLVAGGTVLDLSAGSTRANLGELEDDDDAVTTDADLNAYRLQALDRLGIHMRPPHPREAAALAQGYRLANDFPHTAVAPESMVSTAANRLPIPLVDRVVAMYDHLFDGADGAGDYERTYDILAGLTDAWEHYTTFTNGNPRYFRNYLRTSGEFEQTLSDMDELGELFVAVWTMGATPREMRSALDQVLAPITPTDMGQRKLEIALGVDGLR